MGYTGTFPHTYSPWRQPECQALGGRTPRAFGFEGQQYLSAGAPQGWGNIDTTLGECTQELNCTATQHKEILLQEAGLDLTRCLGGSTGEVGVDCSSVWGKDTDIGGPRKYWSEWDLLDVHILAPRPSPTQQPTGSIAGMPQTKQSARKEHSPIHQKRGCLKLSWAHSYLKAHYLTWLCPPEGQDTAALTRGQEPGPPTRKPVQDPRQKLSHQGSDTRSKRYYYPAACRKETTNTES